MMKEYKYEVGISLCKEDVAFARKLVGSLNPKVKVFFYEDKQEELINKSGPETFSKIFRDECRVVVILSRKEWGKSYYTELEQNAVLERTKTGYDFLMVIPMESGEVPSWYPWTRIYVDPKRFDVENIARFIEYKITEQDGVITPLTSEEFADHFFNQLYAKSDIIQLQSTEEAAKNLQSELQKLKTSFELKVKSFSNQHVFGVGHNSFNYATGEAYFNCGGHQLNLKIDDILNIRSHRNTQQITLNIDLLEALHPSDVKELFSTQYRFYYSTTQQGWAIPEQYYPDKKSFADYLFSDNAGNFYNLRNPIGTEELLDSWFMLLWKSVKEKHIELL